MKYIVDIHGEIDGDYEIIKKYDEPKTGKWIQPIPRGDVVSYGRAYWECDQCHKAVCFGNEMNFCPNCGSYNGGKQK